MLAQRRREFRAGPPGGLANTKFALDGSTEKPSRVSSRVIASRSAMTCSRADWKCASSSNEAMAPACASAPSG